MPQPCLPDTQHVLHAQAYRRDGHPAAEAHKDGLAAALYQLDQVGVQADGPHGHDDKELGQLLEGGEKAGFHPRRGGRSGDHRGQHEEQDKGREDLFQGEAALPGAAGPPRLCRAPQGQRQGDGDDGQGAGELDNGGGVQGVGPGVHPVPGGGRRRDGGGVVHRRAGEEAEALVAQAQRTPQGGEEQGGGHVEQEDHRDGLGDFLVVGADHRGGGGDGGAAADGGAHPHQGGDVGGYLHQLVQGKGHHQGGGDGGQDDGQGLEPHLGDLRQVQAEAQQDHRVLQNFLGGEGDTRLGAPLLPVKQGDHHARQNGEHRPSHHRRRLAQQPAGQGDAQAQKQAKPPVFPNAHSRFLSFYGSCPIIHLNFYHVK